MQERSLLHSSMSAKRLESRASIRLRENTKVSKSIFLIPSISTYDMKRDYIGKSVKEIREMADNGDKRAASVLAYDSAQRIFSGGGETYNYTDKDGIEILEEAIKDFDCSSAKYRLGVYYSMNGNLDKALPLLIDASEAGVCDAQQFLGSTALANKRKLLFQQRSIRKQRIQC
jgi:hypothetical protein